MKINDKIKQLREAKSIQQKTLALTLGVAQSTVSNWESGRQEPNPAQRQKLCKYFGIIEAELFGAISPRINPEILEALQDPIAVKALLITYKNSQDIKNTIKALLDCLPSLTPEKRQAILALCK